MRKRYGVFKRVVSIGIAAGCMALCTACGGDGGEDESTSASKAAETVREEPTTVDLSDVECANTSDDEFRKKVLETMLGKNVSADSIIFDINFDSSIDGQYVSYYSMDEAVIDDDGRLNTAELKSGKEVSVLIKHKKDKWYYKFTVLSGEEAEKAKVEYAAENLLHNADNVRGNITLLEKTGDNGDIEVKWKCDRTDIITTEATGASGEIPAGVVKRGGNDENVKLTATLTTDNYTVTKTFDVTVKAKPAPKEYSAYVYTYFRGNIYGKGESQHIHMAASEDGFFWTALNKNEPILKAELGTKGVRDSYLVRSPEGDHFYLIGTDLDANGGDWASYGGNGSRYIRVWESDDLINWSKERLILIAPENAACMWAPETTYDKTTGEYIVYWATGLKGGDGKKIWYARTRDFYTFSEPKIYKNTENGITFIDTSMIEYQGTYYRFTKNENEISILMETSNAVLGDFTLVKTQIAGEFGVEGPAIYKINGEEKWVLYMDGYTKDNAGVGYFPLIANSLEDLKSANFVRMKAGEYRMPDGAKHGSFVPVTAEEYKALQDKWGN